MTLGLRFSLPRDRQAVGEARRLACSVLVELGAAAADVEPIALALSEACTNAVEHGAGPAPFTLQIELDARSVTIVVSNAGRFEPDDPALEMPEPWVPRGRGVPLMRVLMDEFDVLTSTSRTTVTMSKQLDFTRPSTLLVRA